MSGVFSPHLEILPLAQRRMSLNLAGATRLGFVLCDGTAIALRLDHRTSIDFDFFSGRKLDRETLAGPCRSRATPPCRRISETS